VRVNTHKYTLHGHLHESTLIKLDPTDSVQAGLEDRREEEMWSRGNPWGVSV
jgi:hypothetical protein